MPDRDGTPRYLSWKTESMTGHHQHQAYAGLRFVAKKLVKHLPEGELYVEPFAGHAYVWQALGKPSNAVLGDINCEAVEWIRKRTGKSNPTLKCQDWRKTVKETDSKDTVFLFDPPWKGHYLKDCEANLPYARGHCTLWGPQVAETVKRLKGKSCITLRDTAENRGILCQRPFRCKSVKSDPFFGKTYKTLIGCKD